MQGSINFDPPSNGIDTSNAAAKSIAPCAANLREKVFDFIASRGLRGATADEIEYQLAIDGDTLRPRVWELKKAERIWSSDTTRPTRKGRQAHVLVVSDG